MNSNTNWQEEKFNQIYQDELRGLERRREHDQNLTPEHLEGILKNLYINEGNDWVGRGASADIIFSATIAAYEYFISEWRAEINAH